MYGNATYRDNKIINSGKDQLLLAKQIENVSSYEETLFSRNLFAECKFELLGEVEHKSIQQYSSYYIRKWTIIIVFIVKDLVANRGALFWSAKLPFSLSMHGVFHTCGM